MSVTGHAEGERDRLLTRNGSLKYVSQAEVDEHARRDHIVGRSHDFMVAESGRRPSEAAS